MRIIINNSSMIPIYEQVSSQIRILIIAGELKDGEILPSVEQQFSGPDRRNSPCSVPASCFPDLSDHGKDHGKQRVLKTSPERCFFKNQSILSRCGNRCLSRSFSVCRNLPGIFPAGHIPPEARTGPDGSIRVWHRRRSFWNPSASPRIRRDSPEKPGISSDRAFRRSCH